MDNEATNNEETTNTEQQIETPEINDDKEEPKKTIEQTLAELMADNAKLKRERDRASSEAANYKKQVMSSKSEAEQRAIEKAEEEAKIKQELEDLRRESALNRFEKNYLSLGYPEETAKKAAEAQYENNTDELFQIQRRFFADRDKAIKSQLMKTMPSPSVGNEDGYSVTQAEFDHMSYKDRLNLFQTHPKVYEQLTKK